MISPDTQAVLSEMAAALEGITLKRQPLSNGDIFAAWVNILAASTILRQLDAAELSDDVVARLYRAIEGIDTLGGIA